MIDVYVSSLQEIYNYVTRFLLNQNEKAISSGVCKYRTKNSQGKELKCAVGCILPDSKYDAVYENLILSNLPYFNPMKNSNDRQTRLKYDLLREFQMIHDFNDVVKWHQKFESLAKKYDLKFL